MESMQKCHKKTEAFKNFHGALCQNKLILIQESKIIFYPLILFNPGADYNTGSWPAQSLLGYVVMSEQVFSIVY